MSFPWPTVITGIVGLAGIGGTIASVRITTKAATRDLVLSIAAADKRERIAEKRRIYAACQAGFDEMTRAAILHRQHPDNETLKRRAAEAHDTMYLALSELILIAPDEVSKPASVLAVGLNDYVKATGLGATLQTSDRDQTYGRRVALYEAMRADLGELNS